MNQNRMKQAQALENMEMEDELSARELEEMSRKVYGARMPSSDETATDDIAEPIELEPTEAPESARESAGAPAKENDDA